MRRLARQSAVMTPMNGTTRHCHPSAFARDFAASSLSPSQSLSHVVEATSLAPVALRAALNCPGG